MQFALQRQAAPALPHAAVGRGLHRRRPLPQRPANNLRPGPGRPLLARATPRGARCAASDGSPAPPAPVALRVVFSLRCSVEFGATLKVVGSHDALGEWDVARALPMTWSEGDVWTVTAELPEHFVVRYKVGAQRRTETQGSCAPFPCAPACGALTRPPRAVHRHPRRRHAAVAAGRGQHNHRQPRSGKTRRRCGGASRRLPLERKGATRSARASPRAGIIAARSALSVCAAPSRPAAAHWRRASQRPRPGRLRLLPAAPAALA
jgi:hypothetical protein